MRKTDWFSYTARDFNRLPFAILKQNGGYKEAVIIIHGITAEFHHHIALAEQTSSEADIFFPVLRGYHPSTGKGDLHYIGQYDDDLFDFLHFIRKKGYEKITLIGHSMGCANILRLIHKNKQAADEYIFIAPFFHPALPVYHKDATEQSKDRTDVDYTVYDKRVMFLMTLYKMNINQFNKVTAAVIPDEFNDRGELNLSFRLLASRFLEKIPASLFHPIKDRTYIYVGRDDEVLKAERFKTYMAEEWGMNVNVIEGMDHNHILHHPALFQGWQG